MATAGREIRFLEATPDGRGYLVEVVGGPHDRTIMFVPGPIPGCLTTPQVTGDRYVAPRVRYDDLPPTAQREAQANAERLLLSLLDDGQRQDYVATGGFWVELAGRGQLRLGTLYHLVHRPAAGPVAEQALCVVPTHQAIGAVPPADIWTNLLLSVTTNPDGFFSVAIVRSTRYHHRDGSVPSFTSLGVDTLVRLATNHYRQGDWWNGALAEHELAVRHVRGNRRREALRCAVPAALTICVAEHPAAAAADTARAMVTGTMTRLAPIGWATPGFLDDLLRLSDRRIRARRPDLAGTIDREHRRLADILAPPVKAAE